MSNNLVPHPAGQGFWFLPANHPYASYCIQRPIIPNAFHQLPQMQQLPQIQQSQQIQPPIQQQMQVQLQLPAAQPQPPQSQPQSQPQQPQTKFKIKNIKEKYISHYIDGQLIIETTKPLTETKPKSVKKKKSSQQQQQQQQQQPRQQQIQYQTQSLPLPAPQTLSVPATQQQSMPETQSQPILAPLSQTQQHQQLQHQPPPQLAASSAQTTSKQGAKDVKSLRAEMAKWTVSDVVKFIEEHDDIRQYSSKFAEDEVDGVALGLMIDRNLNFQILTSMFKHGPAMKIEATLSKYKIND